MSQPQTQVPPGDVSIDVSHSSLIVQHGAEAAEAAVKAKPRFTEFVCSPHEVSIAY